MLVSLAKSLVALLAAIVSAVLFALAWVEDALGGAMRSAHVPPQVQDVLAILIAVIFLIAAVRLFGGFIRVALIVLLVVLLLHAVTHQGAVAVSPSMHHASAAAGQLFCNPKA